MKVKKISAIFALMAVLLLFFHAAYEIWSFIKFYYNPAVTTGIAFGFVTCAILHGIMSMYALAVKHDGDTLKLYPKSNIRTIIQRLSVAGVLIILPFHIKTMDWISGHFGGKIFFIVLLILEVLFWGCTFLHVGASFTRALITLGILKERKTQKIIDGIIWVLCAVMFVASVYVIIKTQIFMFNM